MYSKLYLSLKSECLKANSVVIGRDTYRLLCAEHLFYNPCPLTGQNIRSLDEHMSITDSNNKGIKVEFLGAELIDGGENMVGFYTKEHKETLKPCPLCGAPTIALIDKPEQLTSIGLNEWTVCCGGCGVRISRNDKHQVIVDWNKRITK